MYGYFMGDEPQQQQYYGLGAGMIPGYDDGRDSENYGTSTMPSRAGAMTIPLPGALDNITQRPAPTSGGIPMPGMLSNLLGDARIQQPAPQVKQTLPAPISTNAAYQAQQAAPVQPQPQTWQPPQNSMLPGMNVPLPEQPFDRQSPSGSSTGWVQQLLGNMDDQPRINDGFAPGGMNGATPSQWNQQMTHNPYASLPFTDSFMETGPVNTLGYSSRTGTSRPTVDTTGIDQRAMIGRQSAAMMDMIGRQDIARQGNQIDMARFGMQSADRQDAVRQKRQADFDRTIQHIPPGTRSGFIDQADKAGIIDKDVAAHMRLTDVLDRAAAASGMNKETGKPKDLALFIGAAAQGFDPNRVSRADFINRLAGMGITADEVDAVKKKNPALAPFVDSLMGPDGAKQGNSITNAIVNQLAGLVPGSSSALQR